MEIKAVSAERQLGWNPCAVDNGGCTHLCLYRQDSYTCACPDVPDKRKCSTEPKTVVPNQRPGGEMDIIYDDLLDQFGPIHNQTFNDNENMKINRADRNMSTMIIITTIIVLLIILLGIIAVIATMMYNKRKTKKKCLCISGRSVRTFSNPNYFNSTSDNNLNGPQVVEKKSFSWKRVKYDKSQVRFY